MLDKEWYDQMAKLHGYKTGGTIHVVVNNQIGVTTNYLDARSSTYCTDVGRLLVSVHMSMQMIQSGMPCYGDGDRI